MKSVPGTTTDCAATLPLATSTKSIRTSVGGSDGDGWAPPASLGAAEASREAAARAEAVGAAPADPLGPGEAPPAIVWTRRAAIVLPSGDHQNPTTWPSSSCRTLP